MTALGSSFQVYRRQLRLLFRSGLKISPLRALWEYGYWAALSKVIYNIGAQGYLYVAAEILGPVGAGALKACQNLAQPIQLFIMGGTLLTAVGFRRFQKGGNE